MNTKIEQKGRKKINTMTQGENLKRKWKRIVKVSKNTDKLEQRLAKTKTNQNVK